MARVSQLAGKEFSKDGHAAQAVAGTDVLALRRRLAAMARRSRELCSGRRASLGREITERRLGNNRRLLAQYLGGQTLGEHCLVVDQGLDLHRRHGAVALEQLLRMQAGLLSDELVNLDPAELVFMDTETCNLSDGDSLAFMVGVGRIIGRQLVIRQFLLTDYRGEGAMLAAVADFLPARPVLVSYNGKSFDLPLLASRYQQAALANPFQDVRHLDLLHFTRRAFASRWRDCSLKAAERALLAFHRLDDVPGAQAPAVWRELLQHGDWRRIPGLMQHHFLDVLSLPALLVRLCQVFAEPDLFGADSHSIARFYLRQKREDLAEDRLRSREHRRDHQRLLELARLYKKQRRWAEARAIWQELADSRQCPESLENLSKYYEHVEKDYSRAMAFARRLDNHGDGPRCHRLQRKAAPQAFLIPA